MYTKRDEIIDCIGLTCMVPLFWGVYVLSYAVFGG
jgi:hypothetical protein